MRLLVLLLVVSFAIHLGIFAIPFPKRKLEKKEVVPVSIVDIKKDKQLKEQPPIRKTRQKQKPVDKKNTTKQSRNQPQKKVVHNKELQNNQDDNKDFRPKGADDPLVIPDINVPISSNEKTEIPAPNIPKPNIKVPTENAEKQKSVDIEKELSALSVAQNNNIKNNSLSSDMEKEVDIAKNSLKKSLYNFDIEPTGNRKVVHLPPDPIFSLSNDTKVTVRFSIDKKGNTYNIHFVTRSSTEVEKLALNYINRMKFDAILDDREDFAQITIQFKVQK